MEDFYSDWRRRLAVHAALLFLLSIVVGFQYQNVIGYDDLPLCTQANLPYDPADPYDPEKKRICSPGQMKSEWACEFDDPCQPDTVLEHRWRSAHQQGLLHALLLLGIAVAAPYFRVGRFMFAFAGWLIIIGVWGAPIAATIQAIGTTMTKQVTMYCAVTQDNLVVTHCLSNSIGAVSGITTTIAILILGLRSAWEVVREGIAPNTWQNWARIIKARPRKIVTPRHTEQISRIVRRAIRQKTTVRAFGGRYSWSAIAPTDGIMIDMREFTGIDAPVWFDSSSDPYAAPDASHTVRVRAGTRIRQLTERLMRDDLMLQTSPVNPWIQVGGALANGCHGTGVGHEPLVDLVKSIEIIQAVDVNNDGILEVENKIYRRPTKPLDNSPEWKEWQALMVNLGCLGVMHAVTFECVPAYDVHIFDTSMDMRSTIDSDTALRQLIGHPPLTFDADHKRYAEIFWFPFNEELFVRTWRPNLTTGPHGDFSLWFWIKQWVVAKILGPLIFVVMGLFPFLTPFLMRIFHMAFGSTDARVRAPNAMQYERFFMRVFDMGYAIEYDPDEKRGFETFRKAWWQVVEKLENAAHQGAYPQNLVLHVRFGRKSHAFLHPNRGTDSDYKKRGVGSTAYMELLTHVNASRYAEHFQRIERIWHRLGGKSHWAKVTFQPDELLEHYHRTDVEDFLEVRKKMDPGEIFLNDYVRRVLRQ